ncbi:3-oxoacyl-[acyl-carrier-protein] synthase III C-terminal domain-containing protein [Chloroflexota bacterium]
MSGITSYGAYIPLHRLSRAEIAKAWGGAGGAGEKAIASYDEDSITMAVAAALDCVKGFDLQEIDGLYFASTTSPYKEKQAATIAAAAIGLRKDIFTADFSDSLRAGTNALRAALDAVDAGRARSVLVIAGETRLGSPKGDKEMAFGDGAAAVLVGKSKIAVSIEGMYSAYEELLDLWRSDRDVFVRAWEDRFVREAGYTKIVPEAIFETLKRFNLTPADFTKAAIYSPDSRLVSQVAKKLGFDPKTQVQDPLYDSVGNTGAALPLMLLAAVLEEAKAGDKLLLVGYGDGCDVLILKVTEELTKIGDRRGIKRHLDSKKMLSNYGKYVLWRGLMDTEPPARPPIWHISAPALWRDRDLGLSLHGAKCNCCGTPQYPANRVCVVCQAEDDYELYAFADKKATVFTFSHDNLAAAIDPPSTVTVIDFEGGGRLTCDMTDRDIQDVKTDMPVEMSFRKLHYSEGIHNYWWKCTPIRC